MSLSPDQNDQQLLFAELIRAFRRGEPKLDLLTLPDPLKDAGGGDILELCPIFTFGDQVDPSNDKKVAPFSAQQVAGADDETGGVHPGVGYLIARVHPPGAPLPSSSPGEAGRDDRAIEMEARFFVPSVGGKGVATLYASALQLIFGGFSESPAGDPFGYCIVNLVPPVGAVEFISDDTFLAEYAWRVEFLRSSTRTIAGPAPVPVLEESGRVVSDPQGVPVYD